ncbi:MAG: hypothetical protein ACPGU4_05170 [Flavobacteriales bacterium]
MSFALIKFLSILAFIHVVCAIRFTKLIKVSKRFGREQKRLNTIMVWIIPFVWFLIIRHLLADTDIMTKSKRSSKKRFPAASESNYIDNV